MILFSEYLIYLFACFLLTKTKTKHCIPSFSANHWVDIYPINE